MPPKRFWILAALQTASFPLMLAATWRLRIMYAEMGLGEAPSRWPRFLVLALGGLWMLIVALWSRDQERNGPLPDEARARVRQRSWACLLGIFLGSQLAAWGSVAYQVYRTLFTVMRN